jgi:3',5'-cyclic-nucleotide phosphodiesterase
MHDELSQKDVLAALVAAAAHDYKHDGVNNAFHINTHSELATLYNDRSVLENMHAAELFRLMKVKKFNIFSILSPEEFTEARKIATSAILGTDMTKHFNHIADFQSRLAAEAEFTRNPDHGPIPENQKVSRERSEPPAYCTSYE